MVVIMRPQMKRSQNRVLQRQQTLPGVVTRVPTPHHISSDQLNNKSPLRCSASYACGLCECSSRCKDPEAYVKCSNNAVGNETT